MVTNGKSTIDLTESYGFQQGGNGRYFWTVAVAQRDPYLRIGSEASPRTIEISRSGESEPRRRPTMTIMSVAWEIGSDDTKGGKIRCGN